MTKSVYLSSTYRDLIEYRRMAVDVILRINLMPIFMENFPSTDENPLLKISELIKGADIFVGIYAHRYGWIPPDHDKSILEIEYDWARERGIPCVILFIDNDVPWPIDYMDHENRYRMQDLKRRLSLNHIVGFVRSPDDLGVKLLSSIIQYASPPASSDEKTNQIKVTPIFGAPPQQIQYDSQIFMIMPFAPEFQPIYVDHIVPVVNALNQTIKRGDDFFSGGSIITDIWAAIFACRIVIAECTGRNPNVFYELGMAHTIGKNAIMITQRLDDVPFDLRHLRVIEYDYTPRGMKLFEEQLKNAIKSLL